MSCRLESSFIGFPLTRNLNGRKRGSLGYRNVVRIPKRDTYKFKCSKKDDWISRGVNFTHYFGRNVQLLWKNFALRSGGLMYSVKEPLVLSKSLVKSMVPIWQERLLLLRSPAFYVVVSGFFLLFWYSLRKAKSYAETKLLPSVCASLSDYIQRDIDLGKVRGISPLSITLESCSIGPHSEEFSCGEVPSVKIRILPFASLRNRKIVIDAVLSNPSVLVAQKKDFTFLGIPFSEGSLQRHLSDEEGIDYRTKTRRIAREESAARWARERDNAAREAAEKGYVVREWISCLSEGDFTKDGVNPLEKLATTESFFCMDEKLHWRARHAVDTGGEYDMKHADLEKAFGVKIPPSGATFWSRIIPPSVKHKFKKANGKELSAASVAAKRRILERSASAARIYFQALSNGNCGNCTQSSGIFESKSDVNSLVKGDGGTTAVSEEVSFVGVSVLAVSTLTGELSFNDMANGWMCYTLELQEEVKCSEIPYQSSGEVRRRWAGGGQPVGGGASMAAVSKVGQSAVVLSAFSDAVDGRETVSQRSTNSSAMAVEAVRESRHREGDRDFFLGLRQLQHF
nr:Fe(3+) ions import ATP-binding protein like [Ipomoea batatas]